MQRTRATDGFSLVEVLVALSIALVVVTGAAYLFVLAMSSVRDARETTTGTALAVQKVEQLLGEMWTSREMACSPEGALTLDLEGYSEVVDPRGRATGLTPDDTPGERYVRRWSIRPLPGDLGALVVKVLVTTPRRRAVQYESAALAGGVVLTAVAAPREP